LGGNGKSTHEDILPKIALSRHLLTVYFFKNLSNFYAIVSVIGFMEIPRLQYRTWLH